MQTHYSDQIALAKIMGLHSTVLVSWLHTFTYVRNICAHHSRVWNRELAIAMTVPRDGRWTGINTRRIGPVVFAINTFLKGLPLDPDIQKEWHREMDQLMSRSINVVNFYHAMGLSEDFQKHDLWK